MLLKVASCLVLGLILVEGCVECLSAAEEEYGSGTLITLLHLFTAAVSNTPVNERMPT